MEFTNPNQVDNRPKKDGSENLNPIPVNEHPGISLGESTDRRIARLIRSELSLRASQNGFETFEEANDFDVEDDFDVEKQSKYTLLKEEEPIYPNVADSTPSEAGEKAADVTTEGGKSEEKDHNVAQKVSQEET